MNINAPYYIAAINKLVLDHGMTHDDALNMVESMPRNEIEEMVNVHNLVYHAAKALSTGLGLTDYESRKFSEEVLGKTDSTAIQTELKERLSIVLSQEQYIIKGYVSSLLLDVCAATHKAWTQEHTRDFFGAHSVSEQQFLHSTPELIGWGELKKHLAIVEPVVNFIDIPVTEELLKEAYSKKVIEFIQNLQADTQGIQGIGEIGVDTILEIVDAIDNLEQGNNGIVNESIAEAWDHDPELITQIAHQIATKGIGADQELMQILKENAILNRDNPIGLEYE